MENRYAVKPVVCFGEILWDVLPQGRKPGGAPMNVAYHLHQLGICSELISCIGQDQEGKDLLDFLHSIGLATNHIQLTGLLPTSQVLASIGEHHEVSYEIVKPVAWDMIKWEINFNDLLNASGALVFGSLASRDIYTRATLFSMLDAAAYRVFDVNLRVPHFSAELITALLRKSDMVKLNNSELFLIAKWLNPACTTENECIDVLFSRFAIHEVLITKGSKGASYYTPLLRYDYAAYPINVADTIGSGDAFLAAFLAMKLRDEPLDVTLDYAIAMGAFITSQAGACPVYSKNDLERFIWKKKVVTSASAIA